MQRNRQEDLFFSIVYLAVDAVLAGVYAELANIQVAAHSDEVNMIILESRGVVALEGWLPG